jgi:hypothetical protein
MSTARGVLTSSGQTSLNILMTTSSGGVIVLKKLPAKRAFATLVLLYDPPFASIWDIR